MKTLFLGSVALLALIVAGPAAAADMPVRAPLYKAGPAAVAADNWSGFYTGVHLGYGWGRSKISDLDCYSFADPCTPAAPATLDYRFNGMIGGAQVGYNWQIGNLVFGGELDISVSGMKKHLPTPFPGFVAESFSTDLDWVGTGRLRAGYAIDHWLGYVTGGGAYAHVINRYNDPQDNNFAVFSGFKWGWTIGGGLEYAIARNLTLRAEYLFVHLDNSSAILGPAELPTIDRYEWENRFHIVRAGVNYKFDWGGPSFGKGPVGKGPVVTRY